MPRTTAEQRVRDKLFDNLVDKFKNKDSATFRVEKDGKTFTVMCHRYFDYDRGGAWMGDEVVLDGLDQIAAKWLVAHLARAYKAA